jgi:hypothetical protein
MVIEHNKIRNTKENQLADGERGQQQYSLQGQNFNSKAKKTQYFWK